MSESAPSPFELGRMYFHYAREQGRRRTTSRYAIVTDLVSAAWCRETASPANQEAWSESNRALGQCAVTALVVQDLMGGNIVRTEVPGFGSHYSNLLPNGEDAYPLDLTKGQFPQGTVIPQGVTVERDRILVGERAEAALSPQRYALLKERVAELMRAATSR